MEFHGGFGEGGMSWCPCGTYSGSRFNVFDAGRSQGNAAASSARRTVDNSVAEAIQDNFSVEKARALAELEAEVEEQLKATAKALAKPKVDVQAKRKVSSCRKDGDEYDDGEHYVEDEVEDDGDE